jgi:hypothetical protein
MGGMVLETNIVNILQAVKDQGKMHSDSLTKSVAGDSNIRERLGGENGPSSSCTSTSTWQYNW